MSVMYFITYALLMLVIIFDIYLGIKLFEYIYCASIKHQPPLVASNDFLRKCVIEQIMTKYVKAKNICDLGSGFGGLARAVACNTKAKVYALENMPFSAFVSKTLDKLSHCKNNTTIWCDAFKYLDNTDIKFDVAIAYLGPSHIDRVQKYKNKIKVLISMDFAIKNLKPTKIIEAGHGCTLYKRIKYPHRLYIYEFNK